MRLGILLAQRARRDAMQLAIWSVGTALLALLTVVGVDRSYGTDDDRMSLLATVAANPVILLFRGLPSGADRGAFMLFLILPFLALLAALMSSFLAVRHTRAEEESGRAELVGATAAGRRLPLAATVLHGVAANLVLSALTAAAFVATGLGLRGSIVSGFAVGAAGIAFLGVGLVAAQLSRTSRGANTLGVWAIMIAFLACGIGNALGTPSDDLQRIESSPLAWFSPFGWAEQSRPFADDALWPLVLCVGLFAVGAVAATVLQSARDLGEGFMPERHGRRDAPRGLSSAGALVWRLSRASIAGWAVGGALTGLLATSLATVIQQIGTANPAVEQLISALASGDDLERGTIVVFFTLLGILAACSAVQTISRVRQEEARGTAELFLAAPVGRVAWLGAFAGTALLGILVVVAAGVVGAVVGLAGAGGDSALTPDILVTGGGQVVAAAVFVVLTALVFAVAPRLTVLAGWLLVTVATVLGLFGPLFGLPDWAVHLSPFGEAPTVTGDGVDVRGLWWMLAVVVVGGFVVVAAQRRRQLAPER